MRSSLNEAKNREANTVNSKRSSEKSCLLFYRNLVQMTARRKTRKGRETSDRGWKDQSKDLNQRVNHR